MLNHKKLIILLLIIPFLLQSCLNKTAKELNEEAIKCQNDSVAIELFNKAISIDSMSPILYNNRSWRKLKSKDLIGAIADSRKSIELDSGNAEAFSLLGRAYYAQTKFNNAIEDFSIAIKLDSNEFRYLYYRGMSYYMIDSNKLALNDFNKALRMDSDTSNIEAFMCRVAAKTNLNEYNGVLKELNYLIKRYPKNSLFYSLRASYYSHFSEFENSLRDIDYAIKLSPKDPHYYYIRGEVYYYKGEKDSACIDLKKAIELGNKKALDFYKKVCK